VLPTIKTALRILKYFLLSLGVLLILLVIAINLPFAHAWLTQKTNTILKENGLPVSIGQISLSLKGELELQNIKILSHSNDTIIYAGIIDVSFKVLPLFSQKIVVENLFLSDAIARLATDSSGNLNLISIFKINADTSSEKTSSENKWEIEIHNAQLQKVDFEFNDVVNGVFISQTLGNAKLNFKNFSLAQKQIDVEDLLIENAKGIATIAPTEEDTVSSEPSPWKFSAEHIELRNITYSYSDPVTKQIISASLQKAVVGVDKLDLAGKELLVSTMELEVPKLDYTPGVIDSSKQDTAIQSTTATPTKSWSIACKNLDIRKGYFNMQSGDTVAAFSQYMPVKQINTQIKDFTFSSAGAGCNMKQLSLAMSDQIILQSCALNVSADSLMKGSLKLDLLAYTQLKNSASKTFVDTVHVFASLSGSADNLIVENINVIALSGATIEISGTMQSVKEIPNSGCDLKFQTNSISKAQMNELFSVLNINTTLPDFKPFELNGKVSNSFSSPAFNIALKSGSGNVKLDGNYNTSNQQSKFTSTLSGIKLKEIFGEGYPENLTANIKWNGKLGGLNELGGTGSVQIDELVYNNSSTHNFNLYLDIKNNVCVFEALAEDTTLSCDLTGSFGWDGPQYHGNLEGQFAINKTHSNLIPGQLSIESEINSSFAFAPDNINGQLDLREIVLGNTQQTYSTDSILLDLKSNSTTTTSTLASDFLSYEFKAQSSLATFSHAITQIGFEKILRLDSADFLNTQHIEALPTFDLTASAKYDSIFNLFVPDTIFRFDNAKLDLHKTESDKLANLDLKIDSISNNKVTCFGTHLVVEANETAIKSNLSIDSSHIEKALGGPVKFTMDLLADKMTTSLFVADTAGAAVYQLGLVALKQKEQLVFKSTETEWILNSDKWAFSNPEFLTWQIPQNDLIANLNLHHEQMKIEITGRKSDSLKIDFQEVQINKLISPKIISSVPYGILNAHIVYSGNNDQYVDFKMDLKELKWYDVVIDKFGADGYFRMDSSGTIDSKLLALVNDSSSLKVNIAPGVNSSNQNIRADFHNLPIKLIEPFTEEYINDLDGIASGQLNVTTTETNPLIDGNIQLKAITLNVIPLQAWFTIPNDSLLIKENKIYFDQFQVLDSSQKQLLVNGTLNLENTENVIADLKVGLNDIRIMNTTVKDNPDFFGSIIVNSGLSISGPVTQPKIKGNIALQEGTNITYRQINDVSVQETEKTVTFASLINDSAAIAAPLSRLQEISGIPGIQTTIEVNPKSKFNFEISSGYDIRIAISGNGSLDYTMLQNNTMSLSGIYEIKQGTADLKFTGWPVKKFSITQGSSLRWDGDVANPEINLEATSKVEGSYVNPVDNKTRYVDFIVSMKLSNQLSNLDIVFDVKSQDQYITSVLNALPEDEKMRQAVNLLIFESINLPNIESNSNYVDAQVNSFWESQLNSITKTSFKKVDLSFGIDSYTQTSSAGVEEEKTSFSYEMERKFLHDRASVKISGRFNDDPQAGQQSNTMLENFIFEYELDSMERKFLKLYTKKDYEDILDGEVTKSGVGFIYRKSYPDFRSIWRRKKKDPEISQVPEPKIN